ncbi:MAG: redoxin domain-containing protein [Anaerolineales bacterium]|nr:redoxin domain-containing protein [Anaerolineales bacterium]
MEVELNIGQLAPDFALHSLDGILHHLTDERGRVVILNFWSAECPHAARVDASLLPLIKPWGGAVRLLPVAANANEPPEMLRQAAQERGLDIVLYDERQSVADAYGAQTTPHIFVLDRRGILRYQGAYDDVAFRQRVATRNYTEEVVRALLNGDKPKVESVPPFGCTVVRF